MASLLHDQNERRYQTAGNLYCEHEGCKAEAWPCRVPGEELPVAYYCGVHHGPFCPFCGWLMEGEDDIRFGMCYECHLVESTSLYGCEDESEESEE